MVQRVALIGYGAIGQSVHALLQAHGAGQAEVVAVLVRDVAAARASLGRAAPSLVSTLGDVLKRDPTLVVECAGHQAVDAHGVASLVAGIDLLVTSVGSLAELERERALRQAAVQHRRQLILPAGAIGGIDWLAAARSTGLQRVVYRSRKPPAAWAGSAAEAVCDLQALTSAFTFFRGTAREAALRFPRNANVAATVALAGRGFEDTEVEMVADPEARGNQHEVEVQAGGGTMRLGIVGHPDPRNPRTSVMTAHSVVRAILNRSAAVVL
jgi:aspartate dehydrogenase